MTLKQPITLESKFEFDSFDPSICNEPVLLASHYDLDAVGATHFASKLFDVKQKFCCGYPKLLGKLQQFKDVSDTVVFVDLCVPEDTMQFARENFKNIYYCDHHLESENYSRWNDEDNFHYLFSHDYSATYLMASKCEQTTNKKLSYAELQFTMACDHYDMWRSDTSWFKVGYNMNHLFWRDSFFGFEKLLERAAKLEYLQQAVEPEQKEFCLNQNKVIKEYLFNEKNYIDIDSKLKMAVYFFGNDTFFVNDILLLRPEYDIAVGFNAEKMTCSFRTDLPDIDLNAMMQQFKADKRIALGGGHAKACGITFNDGDDGFDTVCELLVDIEKMYYDNK